MNRILTVIVLALAAIMPLAPGQDSNSASTPPAKVVVIPVKGEISKPQLYILRRGLKEAIENKADTLVLDIDTPGGALDVTFEMLKALDKFPGKTVAYVHPEAISAGALISAGTDEIYFAPGGVIGSAAPVLATGGEIDTTMRAKIVSYLKARVRSISEGKGFRGEVISAMIDADTEFKIGDQLIKPKGELLSLTAQEAMKLYGDPPQPLLGEGIAENMDALLKRLHGGEKLSVVNLEVTWSEKLAQYVTALTPVIMALGLISLYIEFKTPGFGFFGIAGILFMGIVFFGHYIAGLSGHEPALFFLLGVILILVEVFFFPGIFVLMIGGALLMFGSLVWAMADFWPDEPLSISGDVLVWPLINVITGFGLSVIGFAALFRFLPKSGPMGGLVLEASVGGISSSVAGSAVLLTGETGVAVTALYPSGQIEIGGKRYEARLALGHAEAGTPVIVTGKTGFTLMVEVSS